MCKRILYLPAFVLIFIPINFALAATDLEDLLHAVQSQQLTTHHAQLI